MADAAGTSLAGIDNMYVMQVAFSVAELGVNCSFGETEQVFFVTGKAEAINTLLVWGVDVGRIVSPEHSEVVRTVRVVASLAFAHLNGTMEIFFPGQFLFDVSQWGIAHVVLIVARQACGNLVEGEKPLVLRIVGRMAGRTAFLLQERFVRHLHCCQLFAYLDMAPDAEIRHLLLEYFCNRRAVGIVAGGAGAILDRRMGNLRLPQGLGKIHVTFQAQIPNRPFEEGLFRRLMGGMAFGTGADCNGTVHELLLERGAVMAPEAEVCPVLAKVQQKPAGAPVRLVAGKTVTLLYRLMHHLLLPKNFVTLCAERWHLGHQFPALCTQQGMLRIYLPVARKAIFFLYRGVRFLRTDNRPVA